MFEKEQHKTTLVAFHQNKTKTPFTPYIKLHFVSRLYLDMI